MDQKYINNAENYLISKGFTPDIINVKNTLDNSGILEIYIHNGTQKYVFHGMTANLCFLAGKRWSLMSDASVDWQNFLLNNTIGKGKLEVLLGIRDIKDRDYEKTLRNVIKNYRNYPLVFDDGAGALVYEGADCCGISEVHQEMLNAEEKAFAFYIATTEDSDEEIEKTIRRRQASYAEFHTNKIRDFIKHEVGVSVNEKGEEVYEFTEEQLALYEILKDLRETTDFVYRHQLYRFDQKKTEKEK